MFKINIFYTLIEYIPLQQGLRHINSLPSRSAKSLIEYIPLQQGLRHFIIFDWWCEKILIEYIPLQQGLRPHKHCCAGNSKSHWVYSITTRIKTVAIHLVAVASLIEYIPLQQGLRLMCDTTQFQTTNIDSLSIFHYNKD